MVEKMLDSKMLGKMHDLLPVKRARLMFGLIFLVMGIIILAVTVLSSNSGINLFLAGLSLFMSGFYFYAMSRGKRYSG